MNLKLACFLSSLLLSAVYASTTTTTTTETSTSSSTSTAFCHPSTSCLSCPPRNPSARQRTTTRRWNFLNDLGELWDEVIEFSTYGPGERAILKARRAEAVAAKAKNEISSESFRRAREKLQGNGEENDCDSISSEALKNEVSFRQSSTRIGTQEGDEDDFDGYAMRDLLVARWGAPLDIEFQRGYDNKFVYCTISPIAFGNRKCRHESEIAYLCHLQGVVEILQKYDNLKPFQEFIESTNKSPKPGTDSVPFRLILTDQELGKILGKL